MKQRPLIETNLYLREPEKARKALIRSAASSTATETGEKVEAIVRRLTAAEKNERVRKRRGSAR